MKYSYYPGCTLRTKAKDLDDYARASARVLGFELEEVEDWQCCGGVYPLGTDEIATKLSSVRALNAAKEKNQELVTICSACHHVIKRVNDDMKNVEDICTRANNYMELDTPYKGETKVLHYLEVLRDRVGFDELKKKVVNPLKGKKIGAYYGCLLLRPGKDHGRLYSRHRRRAGDLSVPQRVLRRVHIFEGKGHGKINVRQDHRERRRLWGRHAHHGLSSVYV